jgi:hypothetical protein
MSVLSWKLIPQTLVLWSRWVDQKDFKLSCSFRDQNNAPLIKALASIDEVGIMRGQIVSGTAYSLFVKALHAAANAFVTFHEC